MRKAIIKFVCPFVIKDVCCLPIDPKRSAELSPFSEGKCFKDARFQEDYSTSLENVIQGFADIEQTTRSSIVHIIACITPRKLRR